MSTDIGLFVLRVVVGGIVAMHGFLKLGWVGQGGSIAGVSGWFQSLGLRPGRFWALMSVLGEAGGGTLTVLGLGGPIGPGLIAADLLVVTYVAHWPQGFWAGGGKVGWEFPFPLAAAGFALAILGPGGWSIDHLLGLSYPDWLLGAWLVLMAIGALTAIGLRTFLAPPPKPS
jgi:putative oxidoreductase